VRNLSSITDSIFHRFSGSVVDCRRYWRICTPSNPTFFWGNFLLFKDPPDRECHSEWMAAHQKEFGSEQEHVAFGWDTEVPGDVSVFVENGFHKDVHSVLTVANPGTLKIANTDVSIRPLAGDSEWEAAIELQVETGIPEDSGDKYRVFKQRQMAGYRRMQERGLGNWWGAFLEDELVGDLGLFFDDELSLGRYQAVETAPAHQGKGICRSLLATAAADALETHPVGRLVLVAETGSRAEGIYQRAGFELCGRSFGLCRVPRRGISLGR
jgi:RimJ/RimL family protein N-acetyltransferase